MCRPLGRGPLCILAYSSNMRNMQLFVNNNVSSFAANIRKLVYSLWRSLNASNNVLVSAALRSDLLVSSPVIRRWRKILF